MKKILKGWRVCCLVHIYTGKGDSHPSPRYKGISGMTFLGKAYGGILMDKVVACTEGFVVVGGLSTTSVFEFCQNGSGSKLALTPRT